MKKTKIIIYLTEALCLVIVLICAYMMLGGDRFSKTVRIYAVIQNSDDNENRALKNGMRDAAKDNNTELIIVDTVRMPDADSQMDIILSEVPKSADAMIIEPAPGIDNPDVFKGITDKNNIVLLKNNIAGDNTDYRGVYADNYGIIKGLLEEGGMVEPRVNNKKLLIVCENRNTKSVNERIDAIYSCIEPDLKELVEIFELDYDFDEKDLLNEMLKSKIIFAIDNKSVISAGEIAVNNALNSRIYGVATSQEAIYMLEKKALDCLAIINDYHLGYNSILEAVKSSKHKAGIRERNNKTYYILKSDNIYSKENETIIKSLNR